MEADFAGKRLRVFGKRFNDPIHAFACVDTRFMYAQRMPILQARRAREASVSRASKRDSAMHFRMMTVRRMQCAMPRDRAPTLPFFVVEMPIRGVRGLRLPGAMEASTLSARLLSWRDWQASGRGFLASGPTGDDACMGSSLLRARAFGS